MPPLKLSESVLHKMSFVLGPKEIMDDRMCPGVKNILALHCHCHTKKFKREERENLTNYYSDVKS